MRLLLPDARFGGKEDGPIQPYLTPHALKRTTFQIRLAVTAVTELLNSRNKVPTHPPSLPHGRRLLII